MNAKKLYRLLLNNKDNKNNKFSIFFEEDKYGTTITVHMGDYGSFKVSKCKGDEEFKTDLGCWVYVEKEYYEYCCFSDIYEGYDYLPMNLAYDNLKRIFN